MVGASALSDIILDEIHKLLKSIKYLDLKHYKVLEKLPDFKQKELTENALALFIDAYHTEVKYSVKVKNLVYM